MYGCLADPQNARRVLLWSNNWDPLFHLYYYYSLSFPSTSLTLLELLPNGDSFRLKINNLNANYIQTQSTWVRLPIVPSLFLSFFLSFFPIFIPNERLLTSFISLLLVRHEARRVSGLYPRHDLDPKKKKKCSPPPMDRQTDSSIVTLLGINARIARITKLKPWFHRLMRMFEDNGDGENAAHCKLLVI